MEPPAPPVLDGGRNAWLFLFAAIMVEGMLYGFQASYGVFLEYYKEHSDFGSNPFLPAVGLLSIGVQRLGSPVITPLMIKHPGYRKYFIWGGWMVCVVSLVASSCATELWHLVLSQGVAFSIGFSILYYPMLNMLNEWWIIRRGFAYGILFGFAGILATILPFPTQQLLRHLGSSWTLQVYAVATFAVIGPSLLLLRTPHRERHPSDAIVPRFDSSVLRKISFTTITFANLLQGLVFYLPPVFIPVFATAIGLSSMEGTIILSVTNLTVTVSQIGTGYLADIADSQILMAASSLLSGLVVFVFWGLAHSLIRLLSFGILFGLFSGGFSVLYTRFATALANDKATQTWLYTILDVQRGVMIVIGGVISGNLVGGPVNQPDYGVGEYKVLIIFTGVCLVGSALGGVGWFFRDKSFYLPSRWRNITGQTQPESPPSVEQLLSAFEYHVGMDVQRGLLRRDNSTHQRYLRSFRQAIEGSLERSFSILTRTSRATTNSQGSEDTDELVPSGATL